MHDRSARSSGGWGLTVLRLVTGALMLGHGLQKLGGWLGGGGLEQTATGFHHLGLRPGRHHAIAAGVTETLSGAGAVLGAVTPLTSAMTTGTMTVAVAKVHGRNGPWIAKGGYEYNATLLAVAFALAAAGPGRAALDGTLLPRRAGLGWAVGQLALGAGVAGAVMWNAARTPDVE
ncbi:MAG TPA: DoxX family protein [Ilumatobacteraceae bacterium]|nr:DoxX family protein [Ilumatobacteraceae bacterium]